MVVVQGWSLGRIVEMCARLSSRIFITFPPQHTHTQNPPTVWRFLRENWPSTYPARSPPTPEKPIESEAELRALLGRAALRI